jgi:hypothetical protein
MIQRNIVLLLKHIFQTFLRKLGLVAASCATGLKPVRQAVVVCFFHLAQVYVYQGMLDSIQMHFLQVFRHDVQANKK